MGPKEDCCICPFHFHGFEPAFLLCVSWNCDFSWTAYHRDWQQVPLDSACLKPEMCTTEAILNHLCQSISTKCEIFAWNCDFQELLVAETRNLQHWIWHASNSKYAPLKPFWCLFPSQNQDNVKFWLFPELPLTKKLKKNPLICMGKKCLQRLSNLHIWVFGYANRNALC